MLLIIFMSLLPCSTDAIWGLFRKRSYVPMLEEFSASDVLSNIELWRSDIALMMYAPWCDYCKQLTPGWLLIRNGLQRGQLKIGKFNCEGSLENKDFCESIGVDRYPSLYFFGYGNFHQDIDGLSLQANSASRIAKYEGELYLDALYDWIWMLKTLSYADRTVNWVLSSFLNPWANSKLKRRIDGLEQEVVVLNRDLNAANEKIIELETLQMFDALNMEGDVFSMMNDTAPNDSNLAFRVCVSELANEYCRYIKDDPFCLDMLPSCAKTFFESKSCRPELCPMKPRGCRVVSTCLRDDVVNEFKISIDQQQQVNRS